jgi:hypothetical protein
MAISLILAAGPSYGDKDITSGAADAAPLNARELQDLVAPIALYPDPLVAEILAASTFPDQAAVAANWLQENNVFAGQALMRAVNDQSWDVSVKALTMVPSVLDNMARNLTWTSALGEACHNQPSEVMAAVQALRAQAKGKGNLQSGPQIKVTQVSPDIIVIESTNPRMAYVPQYDPSVVYGVTYVTPGYTATETVAGPVRGVLNGAWNTDWRGGRVLYNHSDFYGNSAWKGRDDKSAENRGYAARAERPETPPGPGSWAYAGSESKALNAFSGCGGGGWQSRAESIRGWASMHAGGFSGGRFGGARSGGGGFGR